MIRFFLMMTIVAVGAFSSGCHDGSGIPATPSDSSVSQRALDAHNVYIQSVYDEIDQVTSEYSETLRLHIADHVEQEASLTGHALSSDGRQLLEKGILKDYFTTSRKVIEKDSGPGLGEIMNTFHATGESMKLGGDELTAAEKQAIEDQVARHFNEYMVTAGGTNYLDDILDTVLDRWFPAEVLQDDGMISSGSTGAVFQAADESAAFNRKMAAYFPDYNAEQDYNESEHTPVSGHILHRKLDTTHTFDGKTLRIHEPHWEGTDIVVVNDEKRISFPVVNGMEPDDVENTFLAASADLDGHGIEVLVVFKRYLSGTDVRPYRYVAFSLGNAPDYELERLEPVPIFERVTDVAAGDIDADGRDELMVAGRQDAAEVSGVVIFDDPVHSSHLKTSILCDNEGNDTVIRVDSADTNANGYMEIGVLSYPEPCFDGNHVKLLELDRNGNLKAAKKWTLPDETPADILFADLEQVDKIDLYVVQLDDEMDAIQRGWSQPDQSGGSDDECRFFGKATNILNIYGFLYDFVHKTYDSNHGSIKVVSRTYTRQFNESGRNGADDGVSCFAGMCSCDEDFSYDPQNLFTTSKPIYAAPVLTAPDKPARLDVDGIAFDYRPGDQQTVYVAWDYYREDGIHHTHNGSEHYYIPVDSNKDGHDLVTIIQGNYQYAEHSHPRVAATASNTDGDTRQTVWRSYHEYGYKLGLSDGNIKRLAAYANGSVVMEYDGHHVLYSDPQIRYVLGAPPPLGEYTKMIVESGECTGTEHMDRTGSASIFGISVMIGEEIGGPGGEGASEEVAGGIEFKSTQCSGNIERHSEEECLSFGQSCESGSPDLVGINAFITDSYGYRITRDLSNPENVGHVIFVQVPRSDRSSQTKTKYEDQVSVEMLYDNLAEQGLTPDIDIRGLISHDWRNIDSYLNKSQICDFFNHPRNYLAADYRYSAFWHPDKSALVPTSGEEELTYSRTVEDGTGSFEHDQYEVTGKVRLKLEAGFIAHGYVEAEGSIGHEWSFEHEDMVIESNEKTYLFRAEGNDTSSTLNRVGIFRFMAQPSDLMTAPDLLPVNREQLTWFDPNTRFGIALPVLVIDYWLTDDDNIQQLCAD